jgi:hypothetical protein
LGYGTKAGVERRNEAFVDLVGEQPTAARDERFGQRAFARADFEDQVRLRVRYGKPREPSRCLGISEEVLRERAGNA